MKSYIHLFLVVVTVFLLPACSTAPSNELTTKGLYPKYSVTSTGTAASVRVSFQVSGPNSNTYVYLSQGDTMIVTIGGTYVPLTKETDLLGEKYYSGTLAGDYQGQTVTFNLQRTDSASAPDSTVVIPSNFSITSPAASDQFSRLNDAVPITWSPGTAGTIDVNVFCPYCSTVQYSAPDTGTSTVTSGMLASSSYESGPATVTLTRRRYGTLDPALADGGVIEAEQMRQTQFYSVP